MNDGPRRREIWPRSDWGARAQDLPLARSPAYRGPPDEAAPAARRGRHRHFAERLKVLDRQGVRSREITRLLACEISRISQASRVRRWHAHKPLTALGWIRSWASAAAMAAEQRLGVDIPLMSPRLRRHPVRTSPANGGGSRCARRACGSEDAEVLILRHAGVERDKSPTIQGPCVPPSRRGRFHETIRPMKRRGIGGSEDAAIGPVLAVMARASRCGGSRAAVLDRNRPPEGRGAPRRARFDVRLARPMSPVSRSSAPALPSILGIESPFFRYRTRLRARTIPVIGGRRFYQLLTLRLFASVQAATRVTARRARSDLRVFGYLRSGSRVVSGMRPFPPRTQSCRHRRFLGLRGVLRSPWSPPRAPTWYDHRPPPRPVSELS